jgi:hypothetical protein
MDAQRQFLEDMKRHGLHQGHTLGLFHLLIGRRIEKADGVRVSGGLTWRELSALLKQARWPKDAVRELGLEPANLPPRDRQQFWYLAISLAKVDSEEAKRSGERVAAMLEPLGYIVP